MNLSQMNTQELVVFLKEKSISEEICYLLEENEIDGSTLMDLANDIDEFKAVLPKSGHRLKVKKVLSESKNAKDNEAHMDASLITGDSSNPLDQTVDNEEDLVIFVDGEDNVASDEQALMSTSKRNQENTPTKQSEVIINTPESLKRKYGNSPLPDPLPFPDNFSVAVQQAVKNGSVLPVRRQIVNDIGSFYLGITSTPQQGDYKRMALLTCQKFPELRDTTPSNYWLSLQKQLSQFFRNARRKSAPKSVSCESPNTSHTHSAKRFKLLKDDPEAQKRNLKLLKNSKPGSISNATHKSLVEDTFMARRDFIRDTARSSSEVLDMCPYLGKQEHIRGEVRRIFQEDVLVGAVERLTEACRCLVSRKSSKNAELTSQDVFDAIKVVESKTSKKRVTNVIKFKDPSTPIEDMVKDKLVHFRILCIGSTESINQLMIIGESQVFLECPSTSLIQALIDLISAYYVYDITYPDGMAVVMSFLQEVVLKAKDDVYKGTKYSAMMAEINNKLRV